ncbi:branched-chain amino acid ABC transporter substrate-binding protein [Ralstonia mannitolilytica]|uniref:Leucine-, isoleucine-, valine-, threonine-, and alanine-binding protein n=1 Tax=Ralstonia mannitolilytica TaxID=105219 RepID=A0AAD2AII0_9RALS|nr:branched-chain amino acid ABC transporter substrate-binding protein [Ralstonia mannitolilytica]MBY4718993.1 branched-chain amino acid ABC transporter substrate-binding protein [Ralstonia mannitolilytica]CAJ0680130.1 Leucine-, isoleucine-, valine-, threonine-, and alanine-binding protein [Ralstonia mannitolilytica]CAJ0734385.1 Leucine-, isoleucine-, valine-, threonine-, and alanine-binding protein [Ralstonia mannitolilytica]CAJ0855962.1 Leucine-, isoleucine-, valine-, threonine-, and alanine-
MVFRWFVAALAAVGLCGVAAAQPEASPIRLALIEGLSGPFANAGEAVDRNLRIAIEGVNARGGVKLPDGRHPLALVRFDSKNTVDESLLQLQAATDAGIRFVLQGNSSAAAAALSTSISRYNERHPDARVLFLNYAAVDSALTNEACSFWHFRFDASADMRMHALTEVIRTDKAVKKVYLIGQDYTFGRQVAQLARQQLAEKRPDVAIVGEVLHPIGKVKDFAPYVARIAASGADTVITGNWGNDLTLLVKAARDAGLKARFFTFYGNSLGAPAAMGEAGVGRVVAVAEWHPNLGGAKSDAFYKAFRARYSAPADDYPLLRDQMMIDMLAAAIERAGTTEATAVARALEGASLDTGFHRITLRADDHQAIQPLVVMQMERAGTAGAPFDIEGSGYGFRTLRVIPAPQTALPTTCKMARH